MLGMTISVVIPAYNSSRTIRASLHSVLQQTLPADEILALDDGSTDDTASILNSYSPRVTVLHQENRGVAAARNILCERARGDLVAFVDHDDIWHSTYLEVQRKSFADHPNACAFFTWHVNFGGYGNYLWDFDPPEITNEIEVISPLNFLKRYNETTGYFASMSYCCVPKRVLTAIGKEPFRLSGVDDSYLCTTLPLYGEVVYTPSPLVAYRVTNTAQSVDRLKMFALWVRVFELLELRYEREAGQQLRREFSVAFASRKRQYGKVLMAAGKAPEARKQFWQSTGKSIIPSSAAKSIALLLSSYVPSPLQPKWPPLYRLLKEPDQEGQSMTMRRAGS
jgi:glycosyltransferase involved in cell wall biosynthesis